MLHPARTHTPLPRLQPSFSSSRHPVTLRPSLGWETPSDSPARGELAPSPKPFQNESTLAKLQRLHPRPPPRRSLLALPGLGAASRSEPRKAGDRHPLAGAGWAQGRRVEGRGLLPRAAAAVATVRSGLGNPRAAGGPARSRPVDAGRGRGPTAPLASPSRADREVAANKCKLLDPPEQPGENLHARPTQPPAWVGFAAADPGA